ncbi:solute carrier family 12 member 2, putative [Babesia ovata]|uniref:Solute carrier family 12 member 2, putative n=1 Tax=Babesia ovata TaxID=189622 RepID=A0A2H6KKJ1_9APIC|nr:solute carrier family 12 member 2, putative [Babesia ovata]GBE63511.1 solute carrier family 12 member 2, putative [Babesia ovata]
MILKSEGSAEGHTEHEVYHKERGKEPEEDGYRRAGREGTPSGEDHYMDCRLDMDALERRTEDGRGADTAHLGHG